MTTTMEEPQQLLELPEYAESQGAAVRTVRRWLDMGKLPTARKVGGRWLIPVGAVPTQKPQTAVEHSPRHTPAPPVTLLEYVAALPVMLDVATAARLLGISRYAVIQHADFYQLVRHGDNGAWVMPKGRLLELNGGRLNG